MRWSAVIFVLVFGCGGQTGASADAGTGMDGSLGDAIQDRAEEPDGSPEFDSSPNKIPGQCVLSNGIWYCGVGYGNYPDCRTWEAGTCNKNEPCFSCAYGSAGEVCSCWPGDAATCSPSETGCSQ